MLDPSYIYIYNYYTYTIYPLGFELKWRLQSETVGDYIAAVHSYREWVRER